MSTVLRLELPEDRLPTVPQWQQALVDRAIDLALVDRVDLRREVGFLRTNYRGQLSGFEWTYGTEPSGRAPPRRLLGRNAAPAPLPSRFVASFCTGPDLKELACAMSAATVLTELTGGSLSDENGTAISRDDARTIEAEAFSREQEAAAFRADGTAIISAVMTDTSTLDQLRDLPEFVAGSAGHRPRTLPPCVSELVTPRGSLTILASTLLRRQARPVRVLYFDKSDANNWALPWHQDRTVAVQRRADIPGYDVWSVKNGVPHVEPSVDVLRGMLAVRLHIDDCWLDNGPLLAVRRSHRYGRVAAQDIAGRVDPGDVRAYPCRAGDVVVMRGLTIHASDRATSTSHRRVLHVDYAAVELPAGLDWAM